MGEASGLGGGSVGLGWRVHAVVEGRHVEKLTLVKRAVRMHAAHTQIPFHSFSSLLLVSQHPSDHHCDSEVGL